MEKQNIMKTLSDYVTEVFDKDRDGRVTFKEFMSIFPSNAVAIAFLVVDLLVLVAEYRVWDVGYRITNDPFKAVGFVLVSALPFYLAQVLWLYPNARGLQRTIAVLMGGSALFTSAQFGLADLSQSYDVGRIVSMVIWLTVGYVVALLVYVVSDEGIKAKRMEAEAHAKAAHQRRVNEITRSVLADLRESLQEEERLKRDFDPAAVQSQLDRLRGSKGKGERNQSRPPQPVATMAQETEKVSFSGNGSKPVDPTNRQSQ